MLKPGTNNCETASIGNTMAKFIMAGPLQAIGFILLFAILSVFMPLTGLLSNAAIGLVTLRLGWRRGLMIALAGSAVLGGLNLILQGNPLAGFVFGLLAWLPMIGISALLGDTASWSRTLVVLFGVVVAGVVLFHLSVADPIQYWQAQPIWKEFAGLVDTMQVIPADVSPADKQQILDAVAQMIVGSIAATIVVLLIISLLIARHWQAMLYNPGGFREEWLNLRIGKVAAIFMVGMIILALVSKEASSIDVVLVGLAVFVFQGISLVHGTLALTQQHPAWLIGLYVTLFLMPVQVGVLLAAFGIIDGLADFRSQIKARKR
jgi:hypothetical protein